MYAEGKTKSMEKAMGETQRRREIQEAYNTAHGITPTTITKKINPFDYTMADAQAEGSVAAAVNEELAAYGEAELDLDQVIKDLTDKMTLAAENLEFETAAQYRDKIKELQSVKEG